METKDKLKEISKNLQIEVDEIKENDHPMDRCSWPYQAGILISGDEAELIIASLEQIADSKDEIKHGIPFNCPECGKEIQYGLSDETNKIIATSRLFAEGKEIPAGAEEILDKCFEYLNVIYPDDLQKPIIIKAMEEYASIRVKEALQSNNLK